jgi:hypothetical protein
MAGPWENYAPSDDVPANALRITVTPRDAPASAEPGPWTRYQGQGGAVDTAADVAASLGIGTVKGAIGLAGLPGDLAEYGARGIDYATRGADAAIKYLGGEGFDPPAREARAPTYGSADIRGALEQNVTGQLYEPKTTAGRYAQTVGEFLPGAALGPGGMVRNAVNYAVVPGLASEAAGQATKGTALEPWARGGAAVLTGGVSALINSPRTSAQAVRNAIPPGVDPALFMRAQEMVDHAAARGIQLTVPEAAEQLSPGSGAGLLNVMRLLESAPNSRATMAQTFADRPAQIEQAARDTFETIAPRTGAPSMIGPAVGEAATETLGRVNTAINAATRPSYDAARQSLVPQSVHAAMIADPLFEQALNAVRNDPARNSFIRGLSDRSTVVYDAVKQELAERSRNALSPANPSASKTVSAATGTMADDVRRVAVAADRNAMGLAPGQGVGNLERALAEQAQLRQQYLEPLQRGPLGRMADKDTTTRKAIEAVFGTESKVAGSEREIATAMRELSARNPRAAAQLVRAHAEMVFDKAARDLQAGANQFGGANFAKELIGNPQDRANLAAAVQALPNGQQIWRGFENFLEIAQATGKRQRPGSLTAYNAQDLKDMAGGRLVSEGAKVAASPGRLLSRLGEGWDRWQLGRNLNELAGILTDPRAGGYLRGIAQRPVGSNAALVMSGRLAELIAASTTEQRQAK